ncbi:hypothetical protein GQX73_g7919 [Xylaria multiplex]|uniref:NAD(P)-binding domain-containing protein n=1 Tax=Xylaria multiplex TaxID=323545 RepID=A0A7C8MPN2_9PEZI|nr:hypothetical protein GQX73_g7919 [Xylaria multiplex]
MNVIIAGVTGSIGRTVLNEALKSNRHENFSDYPDELMRDLAGAEACIWAVEPRASRSNASSARLLCMEQPLNAAVAFVESLAPVMLGDRKFRFVFLSGTAAERFNYRALFSSRRIQRIRKRGEQFLLRIQRENPSRISVQIARPSRILDTEGSLLNSLMVKLRGFMSVEQVAQSLLLLATYNYGGHIFDADRLIDIVNQELA